MLWWGDELICSAVKGSEKEIERKKSHLAGVVFKQEGLSFPTTEKEEMKIETVQSIKHNLK